MPLPAEHITIGLVILSATDGLGEKKWPWQVLAAAALAIAPDLDVLPGIIIQHDWGYYHRLATHSLFYSCLVGFLAVFFFRYIFRCQLISPWTASAIAFSHVLFDFVFSPWPVFFYWPFSTEFISSHYWIFRFFPIGEALNRAWIINSTCLIIILYIYWREKNRPAGRRTRSLASFFISKFR